MRVLSSKGLRSLSAYFGSLVHDSVRDDVVGAARQQSFIASHVLAGLAALCVFPAYLVVAGRPTAMGAAAFLWCLSPIFTAIYLSRTGRLGTARLISAANFAGLITFASWLSGGTSSFLIAWMVVVPLEAALSSQRRVVILAACFAALGLAGLAVAGDMGLVPPLRHPPLAPVLLGLIGTMSAVLYAAGLALTMQMIQSRTEEAVGTGEEQDHLIAENATDLITRHDERGRVLFASRAAQQLLGVPAQRLHGDGLFERVHVADRPAYLTALSRCQTQGEPISVELRLRRDAGPAEQSYVFVEMRCGKLTRATGSTGVLAGTRDITERKAREAVLVRARDEAESASRAKSQFLANMSHELRTPLNAVIGFSEILDRELFGAMGEQRYRDYARLIHESGEHLLQVVNDILDMSKIEAGKFKIVKEPFDVGALLNSCVEVMRHTAEKKDIALRVEVSGGLPQLIADKRACKQMLLNVIANAIKFTNGKGAVRVAARQDKEMIVLTVSDNGIGISERDLPKLGNPFVQAEASRDRSSEGAGLGLSVVNGLARLHGGRLEIASTLGQGTTATILLPLDAKAEALPAEPASAKDAA
jgi:cell cycle sensor histidine kinase DivJ